MVCTEVQSSKIAGGFVLVSVASLMTVWRACRSKAHGLSIGDFRSYLAAHEMVARRSRKASQPGRDTSLASYSAAELARLTGVTTKRARASIRRLATAGLIHRSG
jgi:DNA-binding MarR family transcriptional regulator